MNIETLSAIAEKKLEHINGTLFDFRKKYLDQFKTNGFGEIIKDSYKFTNLESFFSELSYAPENFDAEIPEFKSDIPTITFLDGEFFGSENLQPEISIKMMKSHFNEVKDLLEATNALSRLHHAFLLDGTIIEVARNQDIPKPLRLLHVLTKSTVSAPTNVIIINSNTKVSIIEETRVLGGTSHAHIAETYIKAHQGSKVEHISVLVENAKGINHSSITAQVKQDASFRSVFVSASGMMNRKNLSINLNAPGAHGDSYALFLTGSGEHCDINTEINHRCEDTTSNQISKGILDGNSKGIFTGKIHIYPRSQRVSSKQMNKNLLLSKSAQVHSQPQLEIFADDVKCSHGSTTGQLSDDEVFYFESRGIPKHKARNILALGFGLEIVQKIENPLSRMHIDQIVKNKLNEKFSIGTL
jgi:Fe-S cluster assembly protein SufD